MPKHATLRLTIVLRIMTEDTVNSVTLLGFGLPLFVVIIRLMLGLWHFGQERFHGQSRGKTTMKSVSVV